jgi:phosphoenolpyruvate carboxykinase (ATP)
MSATPAAEEAQVLASHGISQVRAIYHNLTPAELYEAAIRRGEAVLAANGPLIVHTGKYTGRSPNDKFVVEEASSKEHVGWGKVNKPFAGNYDALRARICAYYQGRELFVQDMRAGASKEHGIRVRLITESAWHTLFARNMFLRLNPTERVGFAPDFTIIHAPHFKAVPQVDGTLSEAFIVLNFARREVLIGGTLYGGEIKKSVFTVLNYLLPLKGVFSMHCSANVDRDGNTALFFGLSGTGKTTISADPERPLIGDDEHGWDDNGIFNFEGGCYAKVIRLSREAEPEIFRTTERFGTVLENVVYDESTRELQLDSDALTENTRACYPITHIDNIVADGRGGHPKTIIFLTADAFGVLPPIAQLTTEQAMYHFLSGYTAKLAGTERGVKEPQPNFSTCFGAPFMSLRPSVYADLLAKKMNQHKSSVWLVNTGWTGGPFGVGKRMAIKHTRAMVRAALTGKLDTAPKQADPIFGVLIPASCPDVPPEVLQPRNTWSDKAAYDAQAKKLASMFRDNFRQFAELVRPEVAAAGPKAD